eukprot:RCo038247
MTTPYPVLDILLSCPVTFGLLAALCAICYYLNDRWVEPERVGFSYLRVVQFREWWRAASSAVSHYSLAHLIFNGAALYSVGLELEPALGTIIRRNTMALSYGELNAGVLVLGSLLHVGVVWALGWCGRGDSLRQATSVGYSGVLFGTMTAHAFGLAGGVPEKLVLLGQVSIPMWASPLISLGIVHLVVPNACFLGHISGILAGGLLAGTSAVWVPPLVVWGLLGLAAGAMLLSFLRPRQPQWHAMVGAAATWDSESAHSGAALPSPQFTHI